MTIKEIIEELEQYDKSVPLRIAIELVKKYNYQKTQIKNLKKQVKELKDLANIPEVVR